MNEANLIVGHERAFSRIVRHPAAEDDERDGHAIPCAALAAPLPRAEIIGMFGRELGACAAAVQKALASVRIMAPPSEGPHVAERPGNGIFSQMTYKLNRRKTPSRPVEMDNIGLKFADYIGDIQMEPADSPPCVLTVPVEAEGEAIQAVSQGNGYDVAVFAGRQDGRVDAIFALNEHDGVHARPAKRSV